MSLLPRLLSSLFSSSVPVSLPLAPSLSPSLPLCLRFALHFWLIAVTRLPMLEILHLPSAAFYTPFSLPLLPPSPSSASLSSSAAFFSTSSAFPLHAFIHSSILHMFLQRTFNYDRNFHFICSSTDFYSNPFISIFLSLPHSVSLSLSVVGALWLGN